MLPAWNGVLLLTVLNFLQNWPVRGSGSSFLAHLSGSDSFCSGIIKLLLPISAARAKTCHFKRSPCVCVTSRQACLSCEWQQLSRAEAETSKTRICLSEGQSTCPVHDPGWWNHTGFSCQHISQTELPLKHPALNLLHWHLQQVCWAATGTPSLNSTPVFCSGV